METKASRFDDKSKPHEITVGKQTAIIWGDTASIDEIFPNMEEKTRVPGQLITVQVKARFCKRYPGDRGYTIPATTLKRYNKVNPKRNAALPGRTFTAAISRDNEGTVNPGDHIYNFRIQGAWATLVQWCVADGGADLVLWSPSGHPTVIIPAPKTLEGQAYGESM